MQIKRQQKELLKVRVQTMLELVKIRKQVNLKKWVKESKGVKLSGLFMVLMVTLVTIII